MKITILGTGAYGISLALMFNKNTKNITMWTKFIDELEMLNKKREHKKVLPGVKIPENISFTDNMREAVSGSDLIVIAIPAAFCDDVFAELRHYITKKQHICIATKGIEQDTCLFINDVLEKYIKTKNVAIISGPSFAIDIASQVPIGLTLATKSKKTESILKEYLQNEVLKLRTTDDIIGTEICGSIKNVIAIAAGILDGLNMPESTQAMFITESLHDIKELIKALGGDGKTILSFAGFGDLLLTCTSTKSRNFRFGLLIGQNKPRKEIQEYIDNTTIEGLYTLKSIHKLLHNKKVNIPIIDLIYDIIFNDVDPNSLKTFLIEKV
ncbi:MAG: NAD(P)-dependent glycerol-3-phosphate dehydrogenase [Firmicutes bacterium]|nr:NAD(P)-dependent glycerol-3-phosphate dehydrogenase [Bacillota bacterium]